jgi:hypothetical protein
MFSLLILFAVIAMFLVVVIYFNVFPSRSGDRASPAPEQAAKPTVVEHRLDRSS